MTNSVASWSRPFLRSNGRTKNRRKVRWRRPSASNSTSLLRKTKWLEERYNSGVVLSFVNIEASSLPSQSELGSAIDSDPSVAACADSFLLDSFGFRQSLAVDLTYSSSSGGLRKFLDFWRTLEVSQFVLNVIMQGYKIPFLQLPTLFVKRNNTSARENSDFCFASCQRFTSLGPNCITCL